MIYTCMTCGRLYSDATEPIAGAICQCPPDKRPAVFHGPQFGVDAADYERLANATRALRSACKDRLPPGHYAKLDSECRIIDHLLNPKS